MESGYQSLLLELKDFPCNFNVEDADKISRHRLNNIKHNIIKELEEDQDCDEEVLRKKNFLTWIYFRLDEIEKSKELSDEINDFLTARKAHPNIPYLANRCVVMNRYGNETEANQCIAALNKLKNCENIDVLIQNANAEQAYCYSRSGGYANLKRAIDLFEVSVSRVPDNYLWKFGLGLAYRRATNPNVFSSSKTIVDVKACYEKAVELLFEVSDKGNSALRALAYCQLLILRKARSSSEANELFRNMDESQLCEKALEHGINNASVLKHCGFIDDVDKSIELLEKSVSRRPNTTAYHHLGLSYKRKAQQLAIRKKQVLDNSSVERISTQLDVVRGITTELSGFGQEDIICTREEKSELKSEFSCNQETESFPIVSVSASSTCYHKDCNSRLVGVFLASSPDSCDYYNTVRSPLCTVRTNCNAVAAKNHCIPQADFLNKKLELNTEPSSAKINSYKQMKVFQTDTCQNDAKEIRNVMLVDNEKFKNCTTKTEEESLQRLNHFSFQDGSQRIQEAGNFEPKMSKTLYQQGITSYLHSSKSDIALDKKDEFIGKAKQCFEKAVNLARENLPAHFDLAVLLNETGDQDEALIKFNYLTNLNESSSGHRLVIISANEESGLLYLQKSKKDNSDTLKFENMGKGKLTKAVGLAADLVNVIPDTEDIQNFWRAFACLKTDIQMNTSSTEQNKKMVKLLQLAGKYRDIVSVVKQLQNYSQGELDDSEVVQVALRSFLATGEIEEAVVFHNFVAIRNPHWWNTDDLLDVRMEVLLTAAFGRLNTGGGDSVHLFQVVFELCFGVCHRQGKDLEDYQAGCMPSTTVGDILFVFDDEVENETFKLGHSLKHVVSRLFGLSVEENLEGTGEFGVVKEGLQLKEMEKYAVVILVLGDKESRDRMFEAMLERIPHIRGPPRQRILVMDVGLTNGQVPLCLRPYPCSKVSDFGCLHDADLSHDSHLTHQDILQHVFDSDIDAVLRLFCFIIGKSWPFPGQLTPTQQNFESKTTDNYI